MKLKKLVASVLSAAMMLSIGSTLAFADEAPSVTYDDTAKTVTFASVMNLSEDAVSAPNVTYTYTIAGVAASAYTYTVDNTSVSSNYIDSTSLVPTAASQPAVFTTSDYATTAHTVTKDVTFDFSAVAFTEPGVYVYEITEEQTAPTTVSGLINGTPATRYLYVSVKNGDAAATSFAVRNIFMTVEALDAQVADDTASVLKSAGYEHSYGVDGTTDPEDPTKPKEPGKPGDPASENFVIDTTAKGDMANRTKVFDFAVAMAAGVDDGTILKVKDEADAPAYIVYLDGADDGEITTAGFYFVTLTTDADGNTTGYTVGDAFTFDMASGESYSILSVVGDMEFTATITDSSDDGYKFYHRDYTTVIDTAWALGEEHTNDVDGDTATADGISFATVRGADDTVDKDGKDVEGDDDTDIEYDKAFPETGVVLDLLPYVLMVALAGAFIAFRVVKSAHKDEE